MNPIVKNWSELFIRLCIVYAALAAGVMIFSGDKETATTVWLAAAASFGIGALIWTGAKLHGWATK